jgi:hypothetical protein
MRAPRPRALCSLVCGYLPREVFFCFFGFDGAVGVFAAPSGFGLLGDTCSFRGLLSMPFYVAARAPSTAGTLTPIRLCLGSRP